MLPNGFVYLEDPRMIYGMNYATEDNFIGRRIDGYYGPICILTAQAAESLIKVQDELSIRFPNYHLKIFDAYRPTRAVEDFIHWAQDPADQKMKEQCYPNLSKPELFQQGYIAKKSAHSRGSTVDLTISVINELTGIEQELDMGTPIDFFGELSHTLNPNISKIAAKNRALLKELMEAQGFENYHKEWWHFTLHNEPFYDTYFNFPVKYSLVK